MSDLANHSPASVATAVDGGSRFVDIGANLVDPMFVGGTYHGKRAHAPDLEAVLARAVAAGVDAIIVTGTDLLDSVRALALARRVNASGAHRVRLHSTVGVHPTSTRQLDGAGSGRRGHGTDVDADELGALAALVAAAPPDKAAYIAALDAVIANGVADGTVVAVGECGLDYDRTHFAPADVQRAHFSLHIDLAARWRLPLFLHDRNCGSDLLELLRDAAPSLPPHPGVVHSFTGDAAGAAAYLALGFDVGINGCSLKTAEGVEVAAGLPLDRLHLETDAPWCGLGRGGAGGVGCAWLGVRTLRGAVGMAGGATHYRAVHACVARLRASSTALAP